jgi:hypothetical protein
MRRVQVVYGGSDYLIGDRSAEEVEREIQTVLDSGSAGWLTVSYGEGRPTSCRLLLTTGVDIAVLELPTDPQDDRSA